jgi:hypothetical protein
LSFFYNIFSKKYNSIFLTDFLKEGVWNFLFKIVENYVDERLKKKILKEKNFLYIIEKKKNSKFIELNSFFFPKKKINIFLYKTIIKTLKYKKILKFKNSKKLKKSYIRLEKNNKIKELFKNNKIKELEKKKKRFFKSKKNFRKRFKIFF